MLKKVVLKNYRCYDKHEIHFDNLAIVVGKNNAGKSTLIEALRLTSLVLSRRLNFLDVPDWLDLPKGTKGVSPSISGLDFSIQNIFHQYGEAPAEVQSHFQNGVKIHIYIGDEGKIYATIFDPKGSLVKSRKIFNAFEMPEMNILPQISPIQQEEKVLKHDTVRSNLATSLASRQFRNQLKFNYEHFPKFRELAESTWNGLGIRDLEGRSLFEDGLLTLIVSDGNFSAEIGWMGHGLQMWLQTMWFLARASDHSTVILDEPDVYMHADLQRKLIRLLKQQYSQVIVATHSIEIMAEVNPSSILVVDKNTKRSKYTTDLPGVQGIIDNIGSIQNIGLARLWSSKKLLLVEGKDIQLLKRIQNTLFPKSEEPLDAIPNSKIGGWGGWNLVKGADLVMKNGLKQNIKTYCILDSDYYPESDIKKRLTEAKTNGIHLHIWSKKEIENFLLCPEALFRIISRENTSDKSVTLGEVKIKLERICEGLKDQVLDNISDRIHNQNKKYTPSKANKEARKIVEEKWAEKESLVSGKAVLKKIREWSQARFGVSFSDTALAQELNEKELHPELVKVLTAIEKCNPL